MVKKFFKKIDHKFPYNIFMGIEYENGKICLPKYIFGIGFTHRTNEIILSFYFGKKEKIYRYNYE